MGMPGFNASVSLYKTKEQYRANYLRKTRVSASSVTAAQLGAFDPCAHCQSLPTPCSRARCACICAGGDIIPSPWARCGFLCV
jgi:hypothetical protein